MADRTLTVNGQPFTINRDRFAGVRTMTRTGKPLNDDTTSIQVTVSGHSDLDGVYTGNGADVQWTQQGGNGRIATQGYNSENGSQRWFIYDNNDYDPNGETSGLFGWEPTHVSLFPWLDLPSSHNVTITPVPETVTVDRTASVIDSDRKGESRPLLSKLVGGAAAAYSLRDLNDKAGNNKVVEVRRSSGGSRKFLAKEVSNGTLTDWVNSGNGVFENTGYESFTNASATGFTASNTTGSGFAVSDIADGVSGDIVKVSFDIVITNGSPKLSLRSAMDGGSQKSNAITYTSSGSKTATLTATGGYVGVGFPEGDVPSNFVVSNFKVLGDGFVETWYDQSGNERHAEQGASANQPKIVDSGVLKKDTDGNPYLQFDGSQYFRIYKNNSLSEGLILPVIQDTFSVCVFSHTTSSSKFLAQLNRSGDRYYLYNRKIIIGNNQTILDSASQNTKHVRSLTASASGVFNSYVDSVLIGTKTDTNTASGGDSSIGATNTGSSGLVGAIYELVAYRTDHSANRLAIEANINNQYEIY